MRQQIVVASPKLACSAGVIAFLKHPHWTSLRAPIGIVEADETFILESFKGRRTDLPPAAHVRGRNPTKTGLSAEQIPVLVARDRSCATLDAVSSKLDRLSVTAVLSGVVTASQPIMPRRRQGQCRIRNSRQARRFAEIVGTRAKTDRVDAAMLARFVALLEPAVRPIVSRTLDQMRRRHTARSALIRDRTATQNRQKNLVVSLLKRQAAPGLLQIEAQILAIKGELFRLVKTDANLHSRFNSLVSIPGIGNTTGFTMVIEMPELGTLEHRQAASLAGLAPVNRESGQWKGKSFITGGRSTQRQALYMPALVAIRFNADFKAKYQAMTAAGKPPKIAIVAVMRKLLVIAKALLKNPRPWTTSLA